MELHDNEKSFPTVASHLTSHFEDSLLQEPPAMKPPVQVSKPLVPDFDSINFSVTSDASDFNNSVYPNHDKHAITRKYLPPFDCIEISPVRTLSNFNTDPSVRPKAKNHVEGVQKSAFQQCAGTNFNSNLNSKPFQTSHQNPNQFTNYSSRNCILDKNGEFRPEFNMQYERNTSLPPGHRDVRGVIINSETVKSPCETQGIPNILNKSDSVIVLSKQLQFQESGNDMNDYFHSGNHMVENVSNPMNGHKKLRKHRSLGGREEQSGYKFQQEPQYIDSGISSSESLSRTSKESVPSEIWTLFHQQNEKIKELQNQLSAIQQQNSKSLSKQESEIQLSEDKKFDMINSSLNSIIQYLVDNNNSILTLKDEVSILAKRTAALELKSRTNVTESSEVSSSGTSPKDKADDASNKSKSKDDVMCHNKTHVKKTSSSTMTSITYDGAEKLLFHKTTVVTENCQQGLLLQCTQNKAPPVNSEQSNNSKNHSNEVAANCCSKCSSTTPKSLDAKKIMSKEAVKSNPGNENVTPSNNRHSPGVSAVKSRTSNGKNSSPLSDSNRESQKREIRPSPKEKNVPIYDRIVRNINNLVLREDEVDEPAEKYCNSDCYYKTPKNSSGTSAAKRKSRSKRNSEASGSASTSEDSDYAGPKSGWTNNGPAYTNDWYNSTKTKYGIPPALMSIDTQQYLERHRLCDNLEKWSSKKSKAPHSKRQLR